LGPVKGPIFTPPREYYIRRDIKQMLALVVGLVLAIVGLWAVHEAGGFAIYTWILVAAGAYLIAAAFLDLALFPPWRF